jgi:hypothetical protein
MQNKEENFQPTKEDGMKQNQKSRDEEQTIFSLNPGERMIINCDVLPYNPYHDMKGGWEVKSHIKHGEIYTDKIKINLYLTEDQKYDTFVTGPELMLHLENENVINANVLWFYWNTQNISQMNGKRINTGKLEVSFFLEQFMQTLPVFHLYCTSSFLKKIRNGIGVNYFLQLMKKSTATTVLCLRHKINNINTI